MDDKSDIIAAWVAREILPYEGSIRNWLVRRWGKAVDADDVMQEAYCRTASLASVDHIGCGRAYFRKIAHGVATDSARHARLINFASVKEIDWFDVLDDEPSADRAVEASQELDRVNVLLSTLSWTCRRVIELRRIEGLSQKETARILGVSESVVENHIVRGLRSVLKSLAEQDAHAVEQEVDVIARR